MTPILNVLTIAQGNKEIIPAPRVRLGHGSHEPGGQLQRDWLGTSFRVMCVMEYVSVLAGEEWSDHPACVDPLLAMLIRSVNDALSITPRQRLVELAPRFIGTVDILDARQWEQVAEQLLGYPPHFRTAPALFRHMAERTNAGHGVEFVLELLDAFEYVAGTRVAQLPAAPKSQPATSGSALIAHVPSASTPRARDVRPHMRRRPTLQAGRCGLGAARRDPESALCLR